ncbi:hypothetical protein [Natronobacterium texcoconense]|uniref:Uncharacterized protein n=1 Tax=Natronobacterium texcoconense TaxID=1095778 RepID=A0A1H1IQP8_NATTX|nr:hypothetical protein [Natronobacterium texcoconense]SDR39930.1 hypothetical protein SAMN04489842_3723 [Natronobacterium texcoconense]
MTANGSGQIVLLVGLAALGIGLAGIGTALGIGEPVTGDEPTAEFELSDDRLTLSSVDQEVTVLENPETAEIIEITESPDGFAVMTEEREPLTDRDRERAKEIARENDTVRERLEELGEYDLTVEPIDEFGSDAGEANAATYNVTVRESDLEQNESLDFEVNETDTVDELSIQDVSGAVTFDRKSTDDGRLVAVEIDDPNHEVGDSATTDIAVVDLDAERVVRVR